MSAQALALPGFVIPGQRLGSATSCVCGPGTHIQGSSICASIAGAVLRNNIDESSPLSKTPGRGVASPGTVTRKKEILSVVREVSLTPSASTPTLTQSKPKARRRVLPGIESTILGRVTRVQKRQATLIILVVLDDNEDLASQAEESVTPDAPNSQQQQQQQQQQRQQQELAKIFSSAASSTLTPDNIPLDDGVSRFQAIIRREDVRAVEKDRVVMDEMFRVGDIVRANIISLGDQSYYYASTAKNVLGVIMARSEAAGGDGGNMMFPVSWKEMRDCVTGKSEPRKVAKPY